jgi:hypothetical protein
MSDKCEEAALKGCATNMNSTHLPHLPYPPCLPYAPYLPLSPLSCRSRSRFSRKN